MIAVLIAVLILVLFVATRYTVDQFMFRPPPCASNKPGKSLVSMLQPKPVNTAILFFHGNASDTRDQPIADRLFQTGMYDVFLPEYPGYNGVRTNRSIASHLKRALRPVFRDPSRRYSKVIFVGQSLGTYYATLAAKDFALSNDSLVLISPFESISLLVGPVLGSLVQLIGKNLDTAKLLQSLDPIQLTIIHGTEDEIIPFSHAKRLQKKFPHATLYPQEGYSHNDLPSSRMAQYITSIGERDTSW